jgi:hypothetical protein
MAGQNDHQNGRGRGSAGPGGRGNARNRRTDARRAERNEAFKNAEAPEPIPAPPPNRVARNPNPIVPPPIAEASANGLLGVSAPGERKLHVAEKIVYDHHGFFDLCYSVYDDAISSDSRLARIFSHDEFQLGMYYYYMLNLLTQAKSYSLTNYQTTLLAELSGSLPQEIQFPVEIVRYFESTGITSNMNGVTINPFVPEEAIPAFVADEESGLIEEAFRQSFFSPLYVSSRLNVAARVAGAALPDGARWHTTPGFMTIPAHRDRLAMIAGRNFVVPSEADTANVVFQISPQLLSDFVSFMATLVTYRQSSTYEFKAHEGINAQFVISNPVNFTANSINIGSDFFCSQPLDLRSAQLGMLSRYLRYVPKELTYRNNAEDVDNVLEMSTIHLRATTCEYRRFEVLRAIYSSYVSSNRRR